MRAAKDLRICAGSPENGLAAGLCHKGLECFSTGLGVFFCNANPVMHCQFFNEKKFNDCNAIIVY